MYFSTNILFPFSYLYKKIKAKSDDDHLTKRFTPSALSSDEKNQNNMNTTLGNIQINKKDILPFQAHPFAQIEYQSKIHMVKKNKDSLGIADCEIYLKENELEWLIHSKQVQKKRYQIIAAIETETMAKKLVERFPERFCFHPTIWSKFPDATDQIEIGGFTPHNVITGEHVIFLASFHNNDVTLSQFQVMITLLQSFVASLTVVLPFYPVGTMERVVKEGQVATANTYAQMFSNLPSCGPPTRVIIYDIHTLQNRFYLHGNAIASLQTTIPILLSEISKLEKTINCVAFPDDGAAKRFSHMFESLGMEVIICGKLRDGDRRLITVKDGDPTNKNIVIVDDLVQSGNTLYECGKALKELGANTCCSFVVHAVFPGESWKKFLKGNERAVFETFWVTNSIPTITNLIPNNDVFQILDITDKVVYDLDFH